MMSASSTAFTMDKQQIMKMEKSLDQLECDKTAVLDSAQFFAFLTKSVELLGKLKDQSAESCEVNLSEWHRTMLRALAVLFSRQDQWDIKVLSLTSLLSYLNHISFHLISIREIPLEWHRNLGNAMLEFLSAYKEDPNHQPKLLSDLAQKTYLYFCTVGKKMQADPKKAHGPQASFYSLYILASAFQCFGPEDKGRDGFKSAAGFLSSYLQVRDSLRSKSKSPVSEQHRQEEEDSCRCMVKFAVVAFTGKPRDVMEETSLSFFVDLFRLCCDLPDLQQALLATGGNLFEWDSSCLGLEFPCIATQQIQQTNKPGSSEMDKESTAHQLVLALLDWSRELTETQSRKPPEKGKKKGSVVKAKHESKSEILSEVGNLLSGLTSPSQALPMSVTDCLVILTHSTSFAQPQDMEPSSLSTVHRLFCLTFEALCRDILHQVANNKDTKQTPSNAVITRTRTLALTNKSRHSVLQTLLTTTQDPETIQEVAVLQKSSLKALCMLNACIKKKNLVDPASSVARQINRDLETAVSVLGSIGRQLRRSELCDVAVQLLSPLWPVAHLEDFLHAVTHHEVLAECYRQLSQHDRVLRVAAEAVKIDPSLLTDTLIRTLAKLARQEGNINLLKAFDVCKSEENVHAELLSKLVNSLMLGASSSAVTGHILQFLQALVCHTAVSSTQKGVYQLMLAEHSWYAQSLDSSDIANQPSTSSILQMLRDAVETLLKEDRGHDLDDYLAQATLLYWNILYTATCSKKNPSNDKETDSEADSDQPVTTPFQPSSPPPPDELVGKDNTEKKGQEARQLSPSVPQTPLADLATTPKRKMLSSVSTPITCVKPQRMTKIMAVKELETGSEGEEEVTEDLFTLKLSECLALWNHWFNSGGHKLLVKVTDEGQASSDEIRIKKSLKFLQRLSDLASLHNKPLLAIQATGRLQTLSSHYKDVKTCQDSTSGLLQLLSKYGSVNAEEISGYHAPEDVYMSSLGLGPESHPTQLADLAVYYFNTGQFSKYLTVYKSVVTYLEQSKQKGPLTSNVTLALATLKRSMAEYLTLPKSVRLEQTGGVEEEESDSQGLHPCAVYTIGEALRYICSVAAFYRGGDSKLSPSSGKGVCQGIWDVVGDYLDILKVSGDLYMDIGSVKYARTHYKEGLTLAQMCGLETWCAVFLIKLCEVSLYLYDTTDEANDFFKKACSILAKSCITATEEASTEGWERLSSLSKLSKDWKKMTGALTCPNHPQSGKKKHTCPTTGNSNFDTMRQQLLQPPATLTKQTSVEIDDNDTSSTSSPGPSLRIFCPGEFCEDCVNVDLTRAVSRLMAVQAQLLNADQADPKLSLKSVYLASCAAQRLSKIDLKKVAQNSLRSSGLDWNLNPASLAHSSTTFPLLQSMLDIVENYFDSLQQVGKSPDFSQDVESILDAVIREGKTFQGTQGCNVLVASAQLWRIQTRHLQVLKEIDQEEEKGEREIEKYLDEDDYLLTELFRDTKETNAKWEEKKAKSLGIVKQSSPAVAKTSSAMRPKSGASFVCKKSQNTPLRSHKTVNASRFVTPKCPSTVKKIAKMAKSKLSSSHVKATLNQTLTPLTSISSMGESIYDLSNIGTESPARLKRLGLLKNLADESFFPDEETKVSKSKSTSVRKKVKSHDKVESSETECKENLSPLSRKLQMLNLSPDLMSSESDDKQDVSQSTKPKTGSRKNSRGSKSGRTSMKKEQGRSRRGGSGGGTEGTPKLVLKRHLELMQSMQIDSPLAGSTPQCKSPVVEALEEAMKNSRKRITSSGRGKGSQSRKTEEGGGEESITGTRRRRKERSENGGDMQDDIEKVREETEEEEEAGKQSPVMKRVKKRTGKVSMTTTAKKSSLQKKMASPELARQQERRDKSLQDGLDLDEDDLELINEEQVVTVVAVVHQHWEQLQQDFLQFQLQQPPHQHLLFQQWIQGMSQHEVLTLFAAHQHDLGPIQPPGPMLNAHQNQSFNPTHPLPHSHSHSQQPPAAAALPEALTSWPASSSPWAPLSSQPPSSWPSSITSVTDPPAVDPSPQPNEQPSVNEVPQAASTNNEAVGQDPDLVASLDLVQQQIDTNGYSDLDWDSIETPRGRPQRKKPAQTEAVKVSPPNRKVSRSSRGATARRTRTTDSTNAGTGSPEGSLDSEKLVEVSSQLENSTEEVEEMELETTLDTSEFDNVCEVTGTRTDCDENRVETGVKRKPRVQGKSKLALKKANVESCDLTKDLNGADSDVSIYTDPQQEEQQLSKPRTGRQRAVNTKSTTSRKTSKKQETNQASQTLSPSLFQEEEEEETVQTISDTLNAVTFKEQSPKAKTSTPTDPAIHSKSRLSSNGEGFTSSEAGSRKSYGSETENEEIIRKVKSRRGAGVTRRKAVVSSELDGQNSEENQETGSNAESDPAVSTAVSESNNKENVSPKSKRDKSADIGRKNIVQKQEIVDEGDSVSCHQKDVNSGERRKKTGPTKGPCGKEDSEVFESTMGHSEDHLEIDIELAIKEVNSRDEMDEKLMERLSCGAQWDGTKGGVCHDSEGVKSLLRRFPSLHSPRAANHVPILQEALSLISDCPPSRLYGNICHTMALTLWENSLLHHQDLDSTTIATYLTEAMQVMFRHQLNRNLRAKLKKCKPSVSESKKESMKANDWSGLSPNDLDIEVKAMSEAVEQLRFGGSLEDKFTERLQALPDNWTVVQLTCVNLTQTSTSDLGQVMVTRMTSDLEPVTVGIPYSRLKDLKLLLRVFEGAIQHEVENMNPQQYWAYRFKRDNQMQNLVYLLQERILHGHHWLLHGQSVWRGDQVVDSLKLWAQKTVQAVQDELQVTLNLGMVRALLEPLLLATTADMLSVLQCVWPGCVSRLVAKHFLSAQKEILTCTEFGNLANCDDRDKTGPVVFILDKNLSRLPWESIPSLSSTTVTRMPSLQAMQALLGLHEKRQRSTYQTGVKRDQVVAVIDPETNLERSVTTLLPQFQQYPGWQCLSQRAPSMTELRQFLVHNSLYLYCGHGWGKQFVCGDDLQMFRAQAVAILMGCHSAKLDYKYKGEADGAPFYFLLAGCPAVLGNLWLVTDRDIDKLTANLVSCWMDGSSKPLGQLLAAARRVCRLIGLNGFAPVVYGLPVTMN